MVDTVTTVHQFTKPEIGGSTDSWGTKLNANWDKVDGFLSGALTSFPLKNGAHTSEFKVNADGTLEFWIDGVMVASLSPTSGFKLTLGANNMELRMVATGLEFWANGVRVGVISLIGKLQMKDDVEAFAGV